MEPQRPPVPLPATPTHHQQPYQQSASATLDNTYNEKDAYPRQQSLHIERAGRSSYDRGRDSVISHPFSPKTTYPPSPTSSISSAGGQRHSSIPEIQCSTTVDQSPRQSPRRPPQVHLDPEKSGDGSSHGHRSPHRRSSTGPNAAVYNQGEYHEKEIEEKVWQLLFYLSGPCGMLSAAITFWTVIALFVSFALAPLRLCTTVPSFSKQLTMFLVPALNLQLHLVYSHNASTDYSAPMLVVIHLLSPFAAFGVAIAAWTAAGFWFFSSILGDPGGHDGHNDGKESILGVRNWWEQWLSRALR